MAKASTTNRRPRLIAVAAVESWSRCRRTVTLHFRRSGFWVWRADREAGFTLVEVIVALAMLSLGLGLVLELVSNGLGRISSAEKVVEDGCITRIFLSEAGTEFPIRPQWRDSSIRAAIDGIWKCSPMIKAIPRAPSRSI